MFCGIITIGASLEVTSLEPSCDNIKGIFFVFHIRIGNLIKIFFFRQDELIKRFRFYKSTIILRIFYMQNTAYKGIDLMPFSNPRFFAETRMEYGGLYLFTNWLRLFDFVLSEDFTSTGIILPSLS